VNASGTRILFVGTGCPRQEIWMSRHRGRIQAVMMGVGAAFDFMAGVKKQAPTVMQRTGTEWVFRLMTEPRRLWRRYLKHNPRFAALFGAQLFRKRLLGSRPERPA
jgi:N-acetylglucosaminyldiphosphoundecaprenol N-acetyl-beta-D-mannosaminyltransferase